MGVKKMIANLYRRTIEIGDIPEKFYLAAALFVVIGFVFLTPPFQGPDEDAHFTRAYQIASGSIILESRSTGLGAELPVEIGETISRTSYSPNIRGYTSQKYSPGVIANEIDDDIDREDDRKFYDTSATATYNPLSYLPAVLGILPVSLVDGPPLAAMYLARIVGGLSTIAIFFAAIKLYPGRRIVPALIFLTPMLLFQQSVISIDGFSYALVALYASLIARLYGVKFIRRKDWVVLGLISVAICCMKPLLFLFVPIVLILLRKDKESIVAVTSILAASLITLVLWFGLISAVYADAPDAPVATGADADGQISYLKDRPLRAIRVAWNTYLTPYGDGQTRGVIGTFGSADTNLPLWVVLLNSIGLLAGIIFTGAKMAGSRISGWRVSLILMLIALYFIGINASMYVAYSPVGFDIFYGVQGRYFLPLLIAGLPLALLGRGIVLSSKDDQSVKRFALVTIIICLTLSVFTVWQRYFLYTP